VRSIDATLDFAAAGTASGAEERTALMILLQAARALLGRAPAKKSQSLRRLRAKKVSPMR